MGKRTERSREESIRWNGKPILAFLVRAAIFTLPILASVLVSIWLSRALPEPQSLIELVRWWVVILAGSTVTLFLVTFGARKFLPLAALMKLTMVFPDKAPNRYKTALRSGSSVKHLKQQLARAEQAEGDDDPTRAAAKILELSNALNAHDRLTRGHAERVRAYTEMLADEMGLPEEDRAKLRWAALLHDIGKLKISTDILNKPGRLDDDEWVEIKKHPSYGQEICAPLLDWLGPYADTIVDHHERFDGNGYPAGKKGEEVSLGGRIVNVSDAFDVMTTVRSYKAAMPATAAREELARHAGAQFDPAVVRAFLNISMGRLRWVAGPLSWLAQLPFLRFVGAINQVGTAVGVAGVAATGVAAVVGAGVVDLPGDRYLDLIPTEGITASAPAFAVRNDAATGDEDTAMTIAVLANDGILDPDAVLSIVTDPEFGTVIINEDGTVTYVPNPGFAGEDRFQYRVTPPGDTATVVVSVRPVNDLPVAGDDRAEVDEDGSVRIPVLANDRDEEGLDPGTVTVIQAPLNGVTSVDAGGVITYTPAADYAGTDGFRYRVSDTEGASADATVTVRVVEVNDPPVAEDDAATLDEDTTVAVDVLANDDDVEDDLDTGSLTVTATPKSGSAMVTGGAVVYTPTRNFSGTDSFRYEICDAAGECARAAVSLRVRPVNDAPVAPGPGDQVTAEDVAVTFDVLAGAVDADGDPLAVTIASSLAFGTLSRSGSVYTYTPAPDYHGPDGLTFSVADGNGGRVFGGIGITVTPVNDPPVVPGPGPLATPEDTAISFDPLAGATDVDGDTVVLDSFDATSVAGGTIVSGSLIYTPPANFSGADTFSYIAADGAGGMVTVTVSIDVAPVADNPVAADDAYSTAEDASLVVPAPGVLGNDSDADADPLTASLAAAPTAGSVALAADGSFTYTPAPDAFGVDSFTYTVADGTGGWDTATVSVTVAPVNDVPVAGNDAAATTEDIGVVIDVVGNDSDVEDETPDPASLALTPAGDGVVVNNGDGTVTYTPDANWNGTDAFTYTIDDAAGATSNVATVTVTVGAVNDVPVAGDDAASTTEDIGVVIDVVGNDSDVEDGVPDPASLALTAAGDGVVVDNGDGTVTYSPDPNWNGTDTFTYTIDDAAGATSNVATVTVTVGAVNDAPVAGDDAGAEYTTSEDTPFTTGNLTGNDTDVEDGTLDPATIAVVAPPAFGVLIDNGDGTFGYTPNANYAGADAFSYTIDDSAGATSNVAVVSLVVTPVNDVPVANDDGGATFATSEDTAFTTPNVTANDTDVEDGSPDATTVTVVSPPGNGALVNNGNGTFTFTPNPHWNGTDTFTYTVDDFTGATSNVATVTITVTAVNDLPVANADGGAAFNTSEDVQFTTGDVTLNDTDVEDGTPNPATVTIVALPSNGTLLNNFDGTFTYKPNLNWSGVDSFTYEVDDFDGGTSNVATVQVVVAAVNDAPVANDDGGAAYTTNEDTFLTTGNVTANDTDVEDGAPDPATVVVVGPTPPGLVNQGDGTFDYSPPPNSNGSVTFSYTVDDLVGATSNVATVTITVTAVNDLPVANADGGAAFNTSEDVQFTTGDVTLNDTDVEDGTPNPATVTIVALPSNGTLLNNFDGTFTYKPNLNWSGVDSFTYEVDDFDGGTSNVATVQIVVAATNDAPVAIPDAGAAFNTNEDTAFTTGNVTANDTDVEDGSPDPTTVVAITLPSSGALINNGNGTFGYTPDPDWFGTISFTYTVDDSAGATSNGAKVTINVASVNDVPVAVDDGGVGFTTSENTAFTTANVTANDTDVEDGTPVPATVAVVGPTPPGLVNNGDGTFTYTPAAGFNGTVTFDYTVDDSVGATSNTATVTIVVNGVNDPPVLDPVGDKTVDELVLLSFTATASDPLDVPPNGLTFSLGGAVPAGASITAGGDFTWTPTEAQGPGIYTFDVVVTDDGTPNLSDSETISVTVNEVNVAPVVTNPGPRSNGEFDVVSRFVVATDADLPANTLAWSAVNLPPGLSINAATGEISGTVSLGASILSPYAVAVSVMDDGAPPLSDAEGFVWTITASNNAPVLDPVGDKSIDESALLSFTATASDPNLLDTLTFSLVGAPAGASITPGGDFTWTPTEAQGGAGYTFDVVVTDDGIPNLADSETITVTVNEINSAPVLNPVGDKTVDELVLLSFTATASDPADTPANGLTFSLVGEPAGASITAGGAFSWTPTEAQGGAGYTFDVVVTDDGAPNLADSETITVTVNEVNLAPVLDPVGDRTVDEQVALAFTATASDADLDTLTFSLVGEPAGASITAGGAFSWTPTEAQGGADYTFDVVVTDDGTPNLADSETITVTVNEVNVAPVLDPIANPQVVKPGNPFALAISGSDQDLPPDVLTITGVGLPAWAAFVDNGNGTADITGTPGAGDLGTSSVTVTISDGALIDSQVFSLVVAEAYTPSPFAGDVVINEVLVKGGSGVKEFIELYNNTSSPIDLTGFVIADWNMIAPDDDGIDVVSGAPNFFDFAFPPGSVLPGNGYLVVWTDSPPPPPSALPSVSLEFWIGVNNQLKDGGDDVWLYDPGGLLVDYIAFGKNKEINSPPAPLAAWWDDTNQDPLSAAVGGASISLTPNGVDSDDSNCWEITSTDTSLCGPITVDNWGSSPHLSSPGGHNTVGVGDLGVAKSVDDDKPSTGEPIQYTITVTNLTENLTTGVVVTDLLPAGVSYLSDDSGGSYDDVTGEWAVGTLDEGDARTLHIDATVTAAAGTTVDNTATITAMDRVDLVPANDSATAGVTVNTPPDAQDDAFVALESEPIALAVLVNDTDINGDPISITGWDANSARGGWVDCSSGITCTYRPIGFASPPDDTFDYTVSDGNGGSTTATVTVTVTPEVGSPLFLQTDGSGLRNRLLPMSPPPFVPYSTGGPADVNDAGDGRAGMTLEKSDTTPSIDESDNKKFQTWSYVIPGGGLTLSGSPSLVLYTAMKDFDTGKHGQLFVRLSHCGPGAPLDSNGCAHLGAIVEVNTDPLPWNPSGGWLRTEFDFGPVGSVPIPAGDELRVKVVVGRDSEDDMAIAFDSVTTPSRLRYL